MREFLMGLVFIAVFMTPCVVALTARINDADLK